MKTQSTKMRNNAVKLKKILTDALLYVAVLMLTGLTNTFVCNFIFVMPTMIVTTNRIIIQLVYFATYFLSVIATYFVLAHRREYKREDFSVRDTLVSWVVSTGIILLLPSLIAVVEYTTGPALPLAKAICLIAKIDTPTLLNYDIPSRIYLPCMLILNLFFAAATVLGSRAGQKKRQAEREKLYNP